LRMPVSLGELEIILLRLAERKSEESKNKTFEKEDFDLREEAS
jgi:hypothetical protein